MRAFLFTLFCVCVASTGAFAQTSPGGLVVFETFSYGVGTPAAMRVDVRANAMNTQTVLFSAAGARLSQNLGVAIANPGSTAATVTFTLRRDDRNTSSVKTVTVGARQQISKFISELFLDIPELPLEFDGSLAVTSDTPVAIVGLLFRRTALGTIPITSVSQFAKAAPQVAPGVGGDDAVILPQFATGSGWSSEIVITNTNAIPVTVRTDLFKPDGTPLTTTLNGRAGSSFTNLAIPAGGVLIQHNDDIGPLQTGYVIVTSVASLNSGAGTINRKFKAGEFMVSLSNGTVQWLQADGVIVKTLATGNYGQAKGMAFDANGNLYVTHWYSADLLAGNNAEVFNAYGSFLGRFGSGYSCNPTSIVFDRAGNAYVGQADCDADILKFDGYGNPVGKFDVPPDARGSSWIDLASDGCTMYYTSAGLRIQRFDICKNQELADFNSIPLPSPAFALRILPSGSVLVAASDSILYIDSTGRLTTTFDADAENCWYSLNIETSSTFLAASYCNANLYRFDLASGAVLGRFNLSADGIRIKSIVVVTPPTTPVTPVTPVPPTTSNVTSCRITGGGSVFTATGIRVTHGFQLRAPATEEPQSLEINWNDPTLGGPDEMSFHLTELTSATCVDNPNIDPEMPSTAYDTFIATGIGTLKGVPGATIQLVFTDAGEPGGIKPNNPTPDTATIIIRDAGGAIVLTVSGPLDQGNHQMH